MAKKKQKCPTCGKTFINLSRHKCALAKKTTKTAKKAKKTTKKTAKKSKVKRKSTAKKSKKSKKSKSTAVESKSKKNRSVNKSTTKRRNYSELDKELLNYMRINKLSYKDILMKVLKTDEKTLEKSIKRLGSKQKISFVQDLVEGIRKLKVTYIEEYEIQDKTDMVCKEGTVWETLGGNPCFLCPDSRKCNTGQIEINPLYCKHLVQWINSSINNKTYVNPFLGNIQEKVKKKAAK